jgi:hypothetical protein
MTAACAWVPAVSQPEDGRVAGDDLFFHRASERGPQHVACVLAGARGNGPSAAVADGAASALALGPGSVFALGAALADTAKLVEPLPDVLDLELIQPLGPEVGDNVQPGKQLVFLICFRCEVGASYFFEPVSEEFLQAGHVGCYWPMGRLIPEFQPGTLRTFMGFALDVLAVAFPGRVGTPYVSPIATFDRVD